MFWAAKVVIISGLAGIYLEIGTKKPDNTGFCVNLPLNYETEKDFHHIVIAARGGYGLLLRETVQS